MTIRQVAVALMGGATLAVLGVLLGPAIPASAADPHHFDLHAVAGTTTLGGQSVKVWGYTPDGAAVTRPGGPPLHVTEGETVEITLYNDLVGENSALFVRGQEMIPDRTGASPGGTATYTFTADRPGTYLYEAGLVPNAQHQVAMGLYGALVVHPATVGQAYADPATAYDDEAVLVLSEIDPALNGRAVPATFDMRNYAPRYFLVNGEAYPDTDPIATEGGRDVLLRYVNAGNQYHSMGVLGAHQRIVALDGSLLSFSRTFVAETFGPGQTADAIVATPATATDRTLPLYDASLLLHNSSTAGSGGMLTSLAVTGAGGAGDTTGPAASNVALAGGELTATIDSGTGGGVVSAAEYFLDTVGAVGTGGQMAPTSGSFDSTTEDVTASVSTPSGEHIFYVRGRDEHGNWGPVSSVLISGADAGGPVTTSPELAPGSTNGGAVAVSATCDDTGSGGSIVAAAEFFVGTAGADGSGTPMTVSGAAAPLVSVDGTIASGTIGGLADGPHPIWIHCQDASDNWGDAVSVDLVVDTAGPGTSGVVANPNPNNGLQSFNSATAAVRVAASLDDAATGGSTIARAELFVDASGATGTGIPLRAGDGVFNDVAENAYADVPLSTVVALSNGSHPLYVHARDAAGNWGPLVEAAQPLVVDKVPPTVSGLVAAPSPTGGVGTVTLSASAAGTGSAVTRAEWFRGADPGVGNGTAMSVSGTGPYGLSALIDVRAWVEGGHPVSVRARDAAGNWSVVSSTVVTVQAPVFFSTAGGSNPPGVGGTADDADLYSWSGTGFSRVFDASVAGLLGGANVDGLDRVDATHFYVSFSADNTSVPGLGNVQDEDVVFYNAGTWSVFFNGTGAGLTGGNLDVDAFSVAGSTVYFSTLGNTNPPGVGGAADDADLYSWNGSSFARVWDASANGFAAGANVDGFVRVDATHFYVSFSAVTTAVPGIGNVQDEDVVYADAGSWSVHFDGTAHGLTSDNLDVDAFDVP